MTMLTLPKTNHRYCDFFVYVTVYAVYVVFFFKDILASSFSKPTFSSVLPENCLNSLTELRTFFPRLMMKKNMFYIEDKGADE